MVEIAGQIATGRRKQKETNRQRRRNKVGEKEDRGGEKIAKNHYQHQQGPVEIESHQEQQLGQHEITPVGNVSLEPGGGG